jgi:sec-independent protein translocase protein TatC
MAKGYEADPKAMTFLEHLSDLRKVLIHSLVAIIVGTAAAWAFSGQLLDLLLATLDLGDVQFLSPMEPFNARMRVAISVGLTISLPFVAFRIWSFVVPALKDNERRVILPSVVATNLLFLIGASFSLYVLTPMMLGLLMGFGTEHARANLALGPVLAFVFRMTVACALLFQLPLVLALTTLLGATTPRLLWRWWRYAVVIIFILAAVLTPGDGPSQVILAVPLIVLYFLSVLISWMIWRGRGDRRSEAHPEGTDRSAGGERNGGDEGSPGGDEPPPTGPPGGDVPGPPVDVRRPPGTTPRVPGPPASRRPAVPERTGPEKTAPERPVPENTAPEGPAAPRERRPNTDGEGETT